MSREMIVLGFCCIGQVLNFHAKGFLLLDNKGKKVLSVEYSGFFQFVHEKFSFI